MNPVLGRILLGISLLTTPALAAESPNTLSDREKSDGWRLLFDGTSTHGWRGFKKKAFPSQGWTVQDGCLGHLGKAGGGDIVTVEKFLDYDFTFEWRMDPGGNSGVKYFIDEKRDGAIGHEYQLLGTTDEAEARKDLKHATASFYDVLPVGTNGASRTPGEWNQSRIVVRGQQVEHWLNGERVLSYALGSDQVLAGITTSKFKTVAGFGTKFPHPVLLQDHGGEIWFRNLKIRPLNP